LDISLEELERLLGERVPLSYRNFVSSKPAVALDRGFDPKTVAVLNLNLRSLDKENWARGRFFLSGDGMGNYYFISEDGGSAKVMLWAHDPLGIEDAGVSVVEFLETCDQEDRVTTKIRPGEVCICGTQVVGESILNPITLSEWKDALAQVEHASYVGFREGANPFTGEKIRFDWPGMGAIENGGRTHRIYLSRGRVVSDDLPVELHGVAEQLARKLGALLHVGS
jgi:hypothetical protein